MTFQDYLVLGMGVFLVLLVLIDVFLTVLHMDSEGLLAPRLFRTIWRAVMTGTRVFPAVRRSLLALAGPIMMAATFVLWLATFILGFSLIIWPFLEQAYRTKDELGALNFIDAFYYAGVTVTVLGYGDITPLNGPLKVLVIAMSGLGFALLTGVVTYLLNVISGASERNALALQVRAASGGTTRGIDVVTRYLQAEDLSGLQQRLFSLLESLQDVQEKMHQFPILDVYYRSKMQSRDPEAIIRTLAEMTIVAGVAAQVRSGKKLRPVALELTASLSQLMRLIIEQHCSRQKAGELESATPDESDAATAQHILERLRPHLEGPEEGAPPDDLLRFICRSRIFLRELHEFSGWQLDHEGDELLRF